MWLPENKQYNSDYLKFQRGGPVRGGHVKNGACLGGWRDPELIGTGMPKNITEAFGWMLLAQLPGNKQPGLPDSL